jgi:metal-sulfur cluster biosynthetic enzyme
MGPAVGYEARVAALMDRLREVRDPCSVGIGSPIDIVSMGLIEDIIIDEVGTVRIQLVLTQPTCWFFAQMRTHIIDSLVDAPGVAAVEVEVVGELWTPDRMRSIPSK